MCVSLFLTTFIETVYAHVNIQGVMLEIRAEKHVILNVKCQLFLQLMSFGALPIVVFPLV
jgi:hypothetical protein